MKKYFRFLSIFVSAFMFAISFATAATRSSEKKQNAIDLGTKIEAALEIKSSSCTEKYTACMDAGCMIDNDSGGRCQCSNKIKELNDQFNKIRAKDYATAKMAEFGKEIVEMGDLADELLSKTSGDDEEDDDNNIDEDGRLLTTSGEYGEALRSTMHDLCIEKMPECKSQLTLIKNLYSQKIKSDCAAFENAITAQNQEAKERRADAKKAVRGAALEQYQASNKYDLGQCVIEFEKCMQTTAECGEDWTGCVGKLGIDKMYSDSTAQVAVNGANSSVMISSSTMEILESKKMICESVTKQCVAVKDKVWDAFLKNVIPDIKIAESKSESDARTSCLTNISNCFINACKDNIDDKSPDSYDLCLSRPESMKHLCKVELEPCLAATGGSYDKPEDSTLWPSVLAKLAAMRVDACTTEVKECIQSEDRCGKDYSKCIGLDTNIIVRMCPYEKLVGCQKIYGKEETKGEEIYDELARIVDGVLLNIDNEMLKTCQNAVDNAMTKVCGDAKSCAAFAINDDKLGTQSLRYQICQYSTDTPETTKGFKWFDCRSDLNQISDYELGRDRTATSEVSGPIKPFAGVISGTINWSSVEIRDDGYIDIDGYLANYKKEYNIPEEEKARVRSELLQLQESINTTINLIEKDSWVSFCVSGRNVPGVTDMFKENKLRFPKLANSLRRQIATEALQRARANYMVLYDKLSDRMAEDLVKINERVSNNIRENGRDAAARAAQRACQGLAETSAFAKAPVGQSLWAKIVIGIIIVIAIIVATIFTCGAAGVAFGASAPGWVTAIAAAGAKAAVLAGTAAAGSAASAAAIAGGASTAAATAAAGTVTGAIGGGIAGAAGIGAAASTAAAGVLMVAGSASAIGTAATLAATGVAIGAAAVTAGMVAGVYAINKSDEEAKAKQEAENEELRQKAAFANSESHGEYVSIDWNYMEKITTDFDRDTMTCKRCITARQCNKTKWHIFSDRNCSSWGDWEEPKCNELKF